MKDPHPDMRGCFAYLPRRPTTASGAPLAHPTGAEFVCPECGRVYVREPHRWRCLPRRERPTLPPTLEN